MENINKAVIIYPYQNLSLEDMDGEVWLPLLNYDTQYLVSNLGRVKALSRLTKGGNGAIQHLIERILSQGINNTGYCAIRRTFIFNNKQTNLVHRLVGECFLPNPCNLPEVNHKKGNKLDNRSVELEWGTRQYNMDHASENFLLSNGLEHFRSKFTEKQVLDIFYSKENHRALAYKYGVSHSVIGFIKRKQSYKKVLNGLDAK